MKNINKVTQFSKTDTFPDVSSSLSKHVVDVYRTNRAGILLPWTACGKVLRSSQNRST